MKHATQSLDRFIFDLQRFDLIDITADDQTATLTEGADTIFIDASKFTDNGGGVHFSGNFGADDKIIVYWEETTAVLLSSYSLNFGTALNISGTNVNRDFSIDINGGFDSLTWTNIENKSATATRYGAKISNNSIVLDTEKNVQTFTLTGIS